MAVNLHGNYCEVFKFKSTGLLPLFDEVISFIAEEYTKGRRWEAVDIRQDDTAFYVRLEEIPPGQNHARPRY